MVTCANGKEVEMTPTLAKQEEANLAEVLYNLREMELYTDKWAIQLSKAAINYASCLGALGEYSEALKILCWAVRYSLWGEDGDEINPSKSVLDAFRYAYELCSQYAGSQPTVRHIFDEDDGLHQSWTLAKYIFSGYSPNIRFRPVPNSKMSPF